MMTLGVLLLRLLNDHLCVLPVFREKRIIFLYIFQGSRLVLLRCRMVMLSLSSTRGSTRRILSVIRAALSLEVWADGGLFHSRA
jgi:hypothetical protein